MKHRSFMVSGNTYSEQIMPDLSLEQSFDGLVCGIDEAGRAPLAGPVTAACVYIPSETVTLEQWAKVTDSKKLSGSLREELFSFITTTCAYGIAHCEPADIDTLNIHHATLLAMKRAQETMVADFQRDPDMTLVDGKFTPPDIQKSQAVVKGDSLSLSIAAASILAKVTRDRLMKKLHRDFPLYGWDTNVGYPTPPHLEAIRMHGITSHHRQSFAPCRQQSLFETA